VLTKPNTEVDPKQNILTYWMTSTFKGIRIIGFPEE